MYREQIPHRRLTAWLFAAVTPTAIQLISGGSWVWTGLICALCVFGVLLRWRFGGGSEPFPIAIGQWLVTVWVLASVSDGAMGSWPGGENKLVPLALLALAAWCALKGPSAAARVGCVLFWFVLIVYLVLFGAGIREVELSRLLPGVGQRPHLAAVILMTPAAAGALRKEKGNTPVRLVLPAVFVLAACVITLGVLSPETAAVCDNAFYEMTRSLSILGAARRFEAVLSAAMTTGWFCLMSLYLCLCGHFAEGVSKGWGRRAVAISASVTAGILLCDMHISGRFLVVATSVFWVVLPIITQWIDAQKKS